MANELEDEDAFMEFLFDLSKKYPATDYRYLRFLLFDLLPIGVLTCKDSKSAFALIIELKIKGHISSTDVKILMEIADLTENITAVNLLREFSSDASKKSEKVSLYRKSLFTALKNVTPHDLKTVRDFYQLGSHGFDNIWDTVFYLEQESRLDSTQKKLERFRKLLNEKAKSKLLDISSLTEDEPSTSTKVTTRGGKRKNEPTFHSAKKLKETTKTDQKTELIPVMRTPEDQQSTVYKNLLWNISEEIDSYGEHKKDMIKYLLKDKVTVTKELEDCSCTFDILKLLEQDCLDSEDISILYEISELTGMRQLKKRLRKHKPKSITNTVFSEYRKEIFDIGRQLSSPEITWICCNYKVPNAECSNQWTILNYLENQGTLSDKKISSFKKMLDLGKRCSFKKVKELQLHIYKINETANDQFDFYVCCMDAKDRVHKYFDNINSLVNWIMRNSVTFHLLVFDNKNYEKLLMMHETRQLLKDLAAIIVPKEYQDEFLRNWKLDIIPIDTIMDKKDFIQMLLDISHAIGTDCEMYVDMLKFLYADIITFKAMFEDAQSAFDLFKLLEEAGYLKPTDVSLLFETIKVTGWDHLKEVLTRHIPYPDEVRFKHFSNDLLNAVEVGKSFSKTNIQMIIQCYQVPVKFSSNQWKVLQYLQDNEIITKAKILSLLKDVTVHFETIAFTEMLKEVSNAIDQDGLNMLRLLYRELGINKMEIENATTALGLFTLLREKHILVPKDISILFETIELTGQKHLKSIMQKYVPYPDKLNFTQISKYRQQVLDLGKQFSVKELQKASGFKEEIFDSSWKLIQELEEKQILTEEKMPSFIESLEANKTDDDFQKLLLNISDAISRDCAMYVDMLKFLYADLVICKTMLEDAKSAFDLFKLLKQAGHLKQNDVSILFETIELTGLKYLKDIIKKHNIPYPENVEITYFSSFLQKFVNLGNRVSKANLQMIIHCYQVPAICCSNQWTVLQYLKDNEIITESKISSIIEDSNVHYENIAFVEMLQKLCNAINKDEIEILRVLYRDLAVNKEKLKNAKTVLDLFRLLRAEDILDPSDISILCETIELTGWKHLKSILENYVQYPDKVKIILISDYRQAVVNLGNKFSIEDLQKVSEINEEAFDSPWELIQHLEEKQILTEERMPSFIESLEENKINKAFVEMLEKLSDVINQNEVEMLQVLYRGLGIDNAKLKNTKTALDLFTLLRSQDILNHRDISILFETTELMGRKQLKSIVEGYAPYPSKVEIIQISKYHQDVLNLEKQFNVEELEKVSGIKSQRTSSWKLIQQLEDKKVLTEEQLSTFTKSLKQDKLIRKYLLETQKMFCLNYNRFTPPIMQSRFEVDIAHMFTDLELLKENKDLGFDAKPITLDDVLYIFKSIPACKVLLEGESGIGKTTLLRYLAYNWSTEKSEQPFKRKIVFYINIRDIGEGEDFLDVIVKRIKLKDFNRKTNLPENSALIEQFLIHHDDEMVLMLDGLDELKTGSESPIRLFKRQDFQRSVVILTSRSENINEFIKNSDVHVKVKGFSERKVQEYIMKYFESNSELGKSLVKKLSSGNHPELWSMCRNPMLLLLTCIMWKNRQIPSDKSELLQQIFLCILNQYNRDESKPKIYRFEDIPNKYVSAMCLLGHCMYHGLKKNKLSINKKDLIGNNDLIEIALKLGFVYKEESYLETMFEEIYAAPHKLIVESLVGFYLYQLCQNTVYMPPTLSLDDKEWENIQENEYLENARKFALGFLGANADKFLKTYITNGLSSYRSLVTHFLPMVKKEHGGAVMKALNDYIANSNLDIKHIIPDVCESLKLLIDHINPNAGVEKDEHIFHLIRKVYNIEIQREMYKFIYTMSPSTKAKFLAHILIAVKEQGDILENIVIKLNNKEVEYFIDECKKLCIKYDITDFTLTATTHTSYFVYLLTNSTNLHKMYFHCNDNTGIFLNNTMKMLSYIKECALKVHYIAISNNNLSKINGTSLATLIEISPNLSTLSMENCNLIGDVINDMMTDCSSRGIKLLQLHYLGISNNNFSNVDGTSMAKLIEISPNLNGLSMNNCNLKGDVINAIMTYCSSRGIKLLGFHDLDISNNNFRNLDGTSLATLMNISPNLNTLSMENCNLKGDVINDMMRECSSRSIKVFQLQYLSISNNNFSKLDGTSMTTLMDISPNLITLSMENCNLKGDVINDMMSDCSCRGIKFFQLHYLGISNNNFSNLDGTSLAKLMNISPNLSTLSIKNCNLKGDVVNDAMRDCTSRGIKLLKLHHLDISNNHFSKLDGASLATLMNISPDLMTLSINKCNLTGDVINDMTDFSSRSIIRLLQLHYLDISNNNFSNLDDISLATLMEISPNLNTLNMKNCNLTGDFINDMMTDFSSRGITLLQ